MRIRAALIAVFAYLLASPAAASAAVGDHLATFTPSPSGNGRGVEMASTASQTAYYSTAGSENLIYLTNMKTHASAGTLTTNLDAIAPGRSFGTLAWDPVNGVLWGAEYSASSGFIDRIDPGSGAVTRVFDASSTDPANTGIDGLAVDADGTLWVSPDGLGLVTTTIYHFSAGGGSLGSITVPFGNSGIAVDGDYLWLADIDNRMIRQYDKAGNATGVNISTAAANIDPEDLTIDNCTFAGKRAIWTFDADFAGAPLAAFELGGGTNAGCPAAPPSKITAPNAPAAGAATRFDATSGDDPTGTLYTYVWQFGDGQSLTGGGIADHVYRCAGYYTVRVTVTSGTTVIATLELSVVVGFPASATKRLRGLLLSPWVRVKGKRATLKLAKRRVAYRGRRAVVRRTTFILDRRVVGRGRVARTKIKRGRRHSLKLKVKFKKLRRGTVVKACFYA